MTDASKSTTGFLSIGTKSLLYGAHQFALHPFFVACAWRKLYGRWPRDLRIWLAFLVHDLGYWGCPNLDGAEGKLHPWGAARWLGLFDYPLRSSLRLVFSRGGPPLFIATRESLDSSMKLCHRDAIAPPGRRHVQKWSRFCLLHSRSLARRYGLPVSKLCAPDKIAAFMMPQWLYLTLTRWTGELEEYMAEADTPAGREQNISIESPEAWFDSVKAYLEMGIVAGGDPGVPPTRSENLHAQAEP